MHLYRLAQWLRIPAIALLSVVLASCGSGSGEDPVIGGEDDTLVTGLRLIFEDDFGGPAGAPRTAGKVPLTVDNWTAVTGYGPDNDGWFNDEWQLYRNSIDNLYIEDGALVIEARCDTAPVCNKRDGSITSARIMTKDKLEIKYGVIKARIKVPEDSSMWPAFWTLGSEWPQTRWPDVGEIDIMEVLPATSDLQTVHFTTHWAGPNDAPTSAGCSGTPGAADPANEIENCFTKTKELDEPLSNKFHVFEVDWNDRVIVGKIDGITYFSQAINPDTMEEFQSRMFMLLNVAVGGDNGVDPSASTVWPQKMLIDWVRVYQAELPAAATLIAETGRNVDYNRIIQSQEFQGNEVTANLNSTAVPAFEGNQVLQVDYTNSITGNPGGANAGFGGIFFEFNSADASYFTNLMFSIDTSRFPGYDDMTIEVKDTSDTAIQVSLSNYTPTPASGSWVTYSIPFSAFAGVDISRILFLGFLNPVNTADELISGTLYIDNIVLVNEFCPANATVEFDAVNYKPDASVAQITVNDTCAANKVVPVKVETGTEKIVVGVDLDAAGHGEAFVNFVGSISVCPTSDENTVIALPGSMPNALMATYTNTYYDPSGSARIDTDTAAAGVDPGAVATNFDGEEFYFYSSSGEPLSFAPDNDFAYSNFDSLSALEGAFPDPTFGTVFQVQSGTGYFSEVAQIALIGGDDYPAFMGFAAGKQSINFKFKNVGSPNDAVQVQFGILGGASTTVVVDLLDTSRSTDIGNGWYEVSVPMTEFPNTDNYNFVAFTSADPAPAIGNPFYYLITDIYLEGPVGGEIGAECGAPVTAAPIPTKLPADVISLLSSANTYPPVVVDTWSQFGPAVLLETTLDGSEIKRYSNLGFTGIQTGSMPIDALEMTHFRIDVWTPDISELEVKLVDFLGDGFGGAGDTEGSVFKPLTKGQWNTIDVPLSEFTTAGLTSRKDLNQLILASTGAAGTLYVGNVYFYKVFCLAGAGRATSGIGYCDDFEAADATAGTIGNGWTTFVNVFDAGGGYLYGYGTFPSPNNTGAISQIASAEGGANQGLQSLSLFSDYNNADHGVGNIIETSSFEEWVLGAGDSATYTLTFDARAPSSGGIAGFTTAVAFIKTLDPNAGFSVSSEATVDLTGVTTTWTSYTVQLVVDASAGQKLGHILQFGSLNAASNYEPSAILFDNVTFVATAPPPPPLCPGGAGRTTSPIGYCDDFETAPDPTDPNIIGNGWKFFVNVFDPGGGYLYGYGPFDSPNNQGKVSQIGSSEGGANQGAQSLALFSDYSNGDHAVGNIIETLNFQEWTDLAESDSATYTLTFDARAPSSGGIVNPSTAKAFIRTLDPLAGFSVSSIGEVDLSGVTTTWTSYTVQLVVDASAGQKLGHILQFGSVNSATNYDPSAILFDNVQFVATPAGGGGGEIAANGGLESGLTGWEATPNGGISELSSAEARTGLNSARLRADVAANGGAASFPDIKLANAGVGVVTNGQALTVTFWTKTVEQTGAVPFFAQLFTEQSGGGASKTDFLIQPPTFLTTGDWQEHSFDVTLGPDASAGVSLLFKADCGASAGCVLEVFIDDVSIKPTVP